MHFYDAYLALSARVFPLCGAILVIDEIYSVIRLNSSFPT